MIALLVSLLLSPTNEEDDTYLLEEADDLIQGINDHVEASFRSLLSKISMVNKIEAMRVEPLESQAISSYSSSAKRRKNNLGDEIHSSAPEKKHELS